MRRPSRRGIRSTLAALIVNVVLLAPTAWSASIPVPLASPAALPPYAVPTYPKRAQKKHKEAVVVVQVTLSEGGGLLGYTIEAGPSGKFLDAVEEALLHTRFIAPKAAPALKQNEFAYGCVPWTLSGTLRYRFTMEGDWPRTAVEAEFARAGAIDSDAVAAANAWMDAYRPAASSSAQGFVPLQPKLRLAPRFDRSATTFLKRTPAYAPLVVKLIMRVDPKGDVVDVLVTGPAEERFNLVRGARTAAEGWKFEPARIDGTPVPQVACQWFNFEPE